MAPQKVSDGPDASGSARLGQEVRAPLTVSRQRYNLPAPCSKSLRRLVSFRLAICPHSAHNATSPIRLVPERPVALPLHKIGRAMSYLPIFADAAFGPTRTKIMGEAFERALKLFDVAPPKIAQEALANRIIEAAHKGERDVDRLVDAALVGSGLATSACVITRPVATRRTCGTP